MSHSLRTLPHWCRAARIVGALLLSVLGMSGCSPEPEPQLGSYRVLATTRRSTTKLIELRTEAERLLTTPDHLFARSTGWTRAGALKVGDVIETAQGRTRVTAFGELQVAPTEVYNLTVDKTHAYFAGRAALLVHNVDCTAPSSTPEQLAEQGRQKERERQHAEQVERDARELRLRRLLDAHKRRNDRVTLNDSPPGTPNCGYCTVAALNDTKKLSDFLRDHGFDEKNPPPEAELHHMMQVLGLSDHSSAPPRVFERYELAEQWQRLLSRGVDRHAMSARRYESMMPEPPARAYMESLPGNTNMVVYRWVERVEEPRGSGRFTTKNMGHALTSVRREGGEIVYVDFQQVPPAVFEKLPTTSYDVVVIPTSVDWRYNRQLYAALRDGKVYASL